MTPLEQAFWCQQYNQYMSGFLALTNIVNHATASDTCAKLADLDLAEFRKRFGDSQVRSHDVLPDGRIANYLIDKLDIATDTPNHNNQTPSTTLYPWELLPEWVVACAKDATGMLYAYEYTPALFENSQSWGYDHKNHSSTGTKYASFDEIEVIWTVTPDWRLSLEQRPGGGV